MYKKIVVGIMLFSLLNFSFACVAVNITAKDGSVIASRDMYWAYDMQWQLMSIPKGSDLVLTAPLDSGLKPVTTKTRYAIVAIGVGPKVVPSTPILDGQNSAGLAMSANFLPGFTQYQAVSKTDKHYMYVLQFGTWLLANFSTVDEVKKEIPKYKVWGSDKLATGPTPPTVHYLITDKSGANIVVEYVKGELHVYTTTVNTLANEPPYDWHLANLGNYIALSKRGSSTVTTPAGDVSQLDKGVGLFGIPGDYSSPSRFTRTAFLRYYSDQPKTDAEARELSLHILNNIDVPYGIIKRNNVVTYTQWISVKDLTHNKLYFADYDHRGNMVSIDADQLFKLTTPRSVPINQFKYPTNDITASLI